MLFKKKGLRKKGFAVISGMVVSLAWAIFVALLLIAALETWRGEPYENGFYYAFVYGCAAWAVLSLLSLEPVNRMFIRLTGKLRLPGKMLYGIHKLAHYTILAPALFLKKIIKLY